MFKETCDAAVVCSKKCGENITKTGKNAVRHFKHFCKMQTWMQVYEIPELEQGYICKADITFDDEFELEWQGYLTKLFSLLGYSEENIGNQ